MRLISILLTAFVFSCGASEKIGNVPVAMSVKRAALCQSFDIMKVERCDRLTFDSLAAAYCPGNRSISKYHRDGVWHRDMKACYTDQDVGSKSECSADGLLGTIHWAMEQNRGSVLSTMAKELSSRNWICGPGPKSLTFVYQLRPLIGGPSMDNPPLSGPLDGFRGHLSALWIWANWKKTGKVSYFEKEILNATRKAERNSPFLEALYQRFHKGEFDRAESLLESMKECRSMWGSCRIAPYYAMTVAVMEGR